MNINKTLSRYLREEDMQNLPAKPVNKFPDLTLGRHNDTEDSVDLEQLKMGIEVELEHVPDGTSSDLAHEIAKRIALDHLAENSKYYTYLKEMEKTNDGPEDNWSKEKEDGSQEED